MPINKFVFRACLDSSRIKESYAFVQFIAGNFKCNMQETLNIATIAVNKATSFVANAEQLFPDIGEVDTLYVRRKVYQPDLSVELGTLLKLAG